MSSAALLDDLKHLQSPRASRATDPVRPAADGIGVAAPRGAAHAVQSIDRPAQQKPVTDAAVARQSRQLPAFAPLLEELEIAGWSSHRGTLSSNFHDWRLLEARVLLVAVGQAVGPGAVDSIEAALVTQAAWASIRAHAQHVRDAGLLLSLVSQNLWPMPNAAVQANVAVAMIDTIEGHASVAMAGDCLAWKIRAATSEQLAVRQPPLGAATDFTYPGHSVQLSLRERLLLVADDPQRRLPKLTSSIASGFARLDAETHRRMVAADAVALVRRHYDQGSEESRSPASIAAVRRR